MGIFRKFSDNPPTFKTRVKSWFSFQETDGNPNKHNFTIKRRLDLGKAVVVEVNYPDCLNHKGNKILVYDDKTILDRGINKKSLDPHFLDIGDSPVARFEPTETGWVYAISFAKILTSL